ncbi:MAG: hypothetical protein AAF670_06825 [Planctomycetota bacterium]
MSPETASFDPTQLAIGIGVVVLVIALIWAWLGFAMKWSLWLTGVGKFGFWSSLGLVLLVTLVSVVVNVSSTFAIGLALGNAASILGLFFGFISAVATIGLITGCGFFRASGVWFVNSMLNVVAGVGLALVMVVVVSAVGASSGGLTNAKMLDELRSVSAGSLEGLDDLEGLSKIGNLDQFDPSALNFGSGTDAAWPAALSGGRVGGAIDAVPTSRQGGEFNTPRPEPWQPGQSAPQRHSATPVPASKPSRAASGLQSNPFIQ